MVVVDIEIALGLVTRNEVDGTPALLSISCAMPPVGERLHLPNKNTKEQEPPLQ